MSASAVLKKARKLIAETGHTKGEMARNKYRHAVDATNPNAVRFCVYGAIHNVMGVKDTDYNAGIPVVAQYLRQAVPADWSDGWGYRTIDGYNDRATTTPKDVDEWFAKAIKLAKADGN